ncbi:MAG: hypothetical protein JWO09_2655 [Bacteroidetes bacterium]|nr:hypothetical protein [Bacteroidota bacterium]
MKNKTLYAAIAGFLLSANVFSATYYVSPAGNDAASGTSAAPWKTISKVNSMALSPGSTILFEGGKTFNGEIILDANDAGDPANLVKISSYGTGRAIINSGADAGFYAYNTSGFTLSDLVFEGSGMTSNISDGVFIYTDLGGDVKLSTINLRNLDIHDYGKTGITLLSQRGNTGYKNVMIDSIHVSQVRENGIVTRGFTMQTHIGWAHQNIVIKNTEVNNVPGYSDASTHRGSGIILGQVDNGLVEKSVAHHNGAGNTHCGGPGGIWAWDCNNVTIQFCESYKNSGGTGCDGLGFDLDGGVTNSFLQYNYSHDNDGAGYLLGQYDYARPWSNNVVRYNISENDGRTNSGGITLFKGPGTTMAGAKIYNNTVYVSPSATNSGLSAFTITDWYTGIIGVVAYNNIFQSTGSVKLVNVPAGYSAFFAGNLYWASGGSLKINYQGTTYNSLAGWRAATANEQSGVTPTGMVANPSMLNPGNGGTVFPNPTSQLNAYQLDGSSVAFNAGLDLQSLYGISRGPNDFFSNAISAGSLYSIGAHEQVPALATNVEALNGTVRKEISVQPSLLKAGDPLFIKDAEMPYSIELISVAGSTVLKDEAVESEAYVLPFVASGMYVVVILDNSGRRKVNKIMIQ